MTRLWVTRMKRIVQPPKCEVCGDPTEGGLVCDVCGLKLVEQTKSHMLLQKGPARLM